MWILKLTRIMDPSSRESWCDFQLFIFKSFSDLYWKTLTDSDSIIYYTNNNSYDTEYMIDILNKEYGDSIHFSFNHENGVGTDVFSKYQKEIDNMFENIDLIYNTICSGVKDIGYIIESYLYNFENRRKILNYEF